MIGGDDPSRAFTEEVDGTLDGSTTVGLSYTITVVDNKRVEGVAGLEATLLHEIGHALNLDHSPVNWFRNLVFSDARFFLLPAMTPNNRFRRMLHADDVASVGGLYQGGDFRGRYGWLTGRVVDEAARRVPVTGVQFYAIKSPDSGELPADLFEYPQIFATITPGGSCAGRFRLAVPVGNYKVQVGSLFPILGVMVERRTFDSDAREGVVVRPGAETRLGDWAIRFNAN
jgi:hypothetical protein